MLEIPGLETENICCKLSVKYFCCYYYCYLVSISKHSLIFPKEMTPYESYEVIHLEVSAGEMFLHERGDGVGIAGSRGQVHLHREAAAESVNPKTGLC